MKSTSQLIWTMAVLLLALHTHACVETDGVGDTNYINLGLPRAGSCVAIPVVYASGSSLCSGVCLNSNWVLTAAHPFTDSSGNILGSAAGILHGPPFTASSPLLAIKASYIFPGFNNSGNGPDLVLLQLATPLNVPMLTIGTANPGDVVTSYGYGQYGTPSRGMNYADGNLRAWQATIDSGVNVGYSSTYFQMTDFGFNNRGLLNGMAGIGDSGGGVFRSGFIS